MWFPMKLGSLITPLRGEVHIYESIEIHVGPYITTMFFGDIGIVIDSGFSQWDIPYLKVVLPDGKIGWLRREKVEVLR